MNRLNLSKTTLRRALAVLFFLLMGRNAMSQTLAIFPLLDLTEGPNGINTVLTDHVRLETEKLGFEQVPGQEIMQFLIRHRIRSLGRLTSHEVSLAGEELGADFVMQGTVCQLQQYMPAMVSLSLQMIRTSDASTVWAHTESLYYADLLTLLGLSDPKSMDDLYRVFFPRLLADIPHAATPAEQIEEQLDIDTVVLRPRHVRPGETLSCKVRIFVSRREDMVLPDIVAWIGQHEYPLALDEEEYYYETSWPAQNQAGEYTVTLVGTWPSGQSRSAVIGTYYVDDRAPEIRLHVFGKELDGRVAFSNTLTMVPQLVDPEPVSRFLIQVISENGEVIVNQGDSGYLPRRITWQGRTNLGEVVSDGRYRIVFRVWDRVGRESAAEAEISFLHQPPIVTIDVRKDNGTVAVDLENLMKTPVDFWWMKFFDGAGRQLKLAQGEILPAVIELEMPPMEEGDEEVLEGLLQVRDIL
ncbi:MAG: hypothetical protein OEL85_10170, partial [Desulfobulbaceae bacterium]|nr:hypothetical protein [Desulfobulbaceae bacterium]